MTTEERIEKEARILSQNFSSDPMYGSGVYLGYERGATSEHSRLTELLNSLDTALRELQTKEIEYKECSVQDNLNYEYFKGKRDAYEFSVKTIKRVLQWHEIP